MKINIMYLEQTRITEEDIEKNGGEFFFEFPKAHKVTVRFEDEETSLDAITTALSDRGYQVARQKQLR